MASAVTRDERIAHRAELRQANLKVWSAGPSRPTANLDATLKKNSGYVKRLRAGLVADSRDALVREANTLSLDRYVDELVAAVPEGLTRSTKDRDVVAAADVLSALFGRFGPDFIDPIASNIEKELRPPPPRGTAVANQDAKQKELLKAAENARISKHKTLVRVATECALVDLFRSDAASEPGEESLTYLYNMTRNLLANDREHSNVSVLVALLKAYGPVLLGPAPAKGESVAEKPTTESNASAPLTPEWQAKFRQLAEPYFAALSKKITKAHSKLLAQDVRNQEAYIRSGIIFEDRAQAYEAQTKLFDTIMDQATALAELLGAPPPKLEAAQESKTSVVNLDATSSLADQRSGDTGVWEDEETKAFYEDLLDVGSSVPPSLVSTEAGAKPNDPSERGWGKAPEEAPPGDDTSAALEPSPPVEPEVSDEPPAEEAGPTEEEEAGRDKEGADAADRAEVGARRAAQLNLLLARLPELTNRTMIDSAAVEFVYLNSKAARGKLERTLLSIPRNRGDLAPYYARLVATLGKYWPDIGEAVATALSSLMFGALKRRGAAVADLGATDSRNKAARFLGELTKFQVVPVHVILHALKMAMDDMGVAAVEVLSTLFETCGRFLLSQSATGAKTKALLERLKRLRSSSTTLSAAQQLALDNAYYACIPPPRGTRQVKERTPMDLFIRYLIYDVLTKKHVDKVVRLLRQLHWDQAETQHTLMSVFTKPHKLKWPDIPLMALVLKDLQGPHPEFVTAVIDTVVEKIRLGMELNQVPMAQVRVAQVAYLGELYNAGLITTGLLFYHLWSFVTFAHPIPPSPAPPTGTSAIPLDAGTAASAPPPSYNYGYYHATQLDQADDYFRIRLVCHLINTTAVEGWYERNPCKRHMQAFLSFFNLYVLTKAVPLPLDIDYMLGDALDLIPAAVSAVGGWTWDFPVALERYENSRSEAVAGAAQAHVDDEDEEEEEEEDEAKPMPRLDDDLITGEGDEGLDEPLDGEPVPAESDHGNDTDEDDDEELDEDSEALLMAKQQEEWERAQKKEADDAFARELAKMMADSTPTPNVQSGSSRGKLFDAAIPILKKPPTGPLREADFPTVGQTEVPDAPKHMTFSLLSKKGNKVQTHDLAIPVDSTFAETTRTHQAEAAKEKQAIKKLVLSYASNEERDASGRSAQDDPLSMYRRPRPSRDVLP